MITLYSLEPFAQVVAKDKITELPLFQFANEEIWADVNGFKGFYLISTHGNVMSNYHTLERRVSVQWSKNHCAYRVKLYANGKKIYRSLARLMKMTFDPIADMEHKCVTYKNGNPRNVTLKNLIWIDNPGSKLTPDDVRAIRAIPFAKYNMHEIALKYGVRVDAISDVLTCSTWWWV